MAVPGQRRRAVHDRGEDGELPPERDRRHAQGALPQRLELGLVQLVDAPGVFSEAEFYCCPCL
jgi:hypothetical protein